MEVAIQLLMRGTYSVQESHTFPTHPPTHPLTQWVFKANTRFSYGESLEEWAGTQRWVWYNTVSHKWDKLNYFRFFNLVFLVYLHYCIYTLVLFCFKSKGKRRLRWERGGKKKTLLECFKI